MAAWASMLASSYANLNMQASCEQRYGNYFKVAANSSGFKLMDTEGDGVQLVRSTMGKS